MKRLSVVILLAGLAGCNYPSLSQAEEACDAWSKKVTIRSYRSKLDSIKPPDRKAQLDEGIAEFKKESPPDYYNTREEQDEWFKERLWAVKSIYLMNVEWDKTAREMIDHKLSARWCREEEETKQFLGWENKAVLNGTWENVKGKTGEGKLVKHFRY